MPTRRHTWTLLLLLGLAPVAPALGQDDTPKDDAPPDEVVTNHEATIGGERRKYTATAGMLPIRDDRGKVEAKIFYIAYTLDDAGDPARRPLMFSFNGGPGSSSVWLHLGALGPKRVVIPDDATIPAPPFQLVDNEHSWLDKADLVFIDPVATGYSRAETAELTRKFHGLRGDIDSVAEFIRLYLTRAERWASPLYVVGESYGTTRAAGLSGRLVQRHGIALNGVILVSTILNYQTNEMDKGNDLPYALFLPTYTATAWYHKALPEDLQADLDRALAESEAYALGDYMTALARGDALSDEERRAVAAKVARLTGLGEQYVLDSRLRIEDAMFRKELLRGRDRSVGRLDSRFLGLEASAATDRPETDPSMAAIRAPYTAMFNQYVRTALGYKTERPYYILGEGVSGWDWGQPGNRYADTSESLRQAFVANPHLKLFVASGYYDMATPYFAAEYSLTHTGLDPSLRANVRVEEYRSGHMMYIHTPSLEKLKQDVGRFLDDSDGL